MSQHRDALRIAQQLRKDAFAIRRRVRAASRRDAASIVADVLRNPDRAAGTMGVEQLLLCIPRLGEFQVRRMLAIAAITKVQRVREVTPGRRDILALTVEEWADGELRRTA